MVFEKISKGVSITDAPYQVNKQLNGATAGCGPAHRIAPLAGFKKIKTNQLIELALQEASITHLHPNAGKCSAIMAMLCRFLLEGCSWEESKKKIIQNDTIQSTWLDIKKANLNNGGYVLDVMHSAMHFLDMKDSLEKSLSFAGPANYCPVIVGIIEYIRNNFVKQLT